MLTGATPPATSIPGDPLPELPEVEVTRRRIAPLLEGRRIARIRTTTNSYFFLTPPARLRRALQGRVVESLDRRGKYLVGQIEGGGRLLLHLGMTGQLFSADALSLRLLSATTRSALAPDAQATFRPDAHTHLQVYFEDAGQPVYFRDVRKFGKVLWLAANETNPRLERLGPDALGVTGELLFSATRKRKTSLKAVLLDQSVLAGVGNIYADESLFHANVRPSRRAYRVTRAECAKVADALRRVLKRSIETGGSSISDYVAPDGSDGTYQSERRVYARAGEPCHTCGAKIRKSVVAQRGTHHCPVCQR